MLNKVSLDWSLEQGRVMVQRVKGHEKVVVLALPGHQKMELAQRQELQVHIQFQKCP